MTIHKDDWWRDIPGYEGAYQISRDGQVRTWRWRGDHFSKEPRFLTKYIRKARYGRKPKRQYVKLTDSRGKPKDAAVIRLMVITWLGGYPPGKVAYHKNGDTRDDSLNNIGFISSRELGRKTGGKSKRIPVAKVDEAGEVVAVYTSARQAAKANHLSYQSVLDRCHGKIRNPFALDGHTYRFDD